MYKEINIYIDTHTETIVYLNKLIYILAYRVVCGDRSCTNLMFNVYSLCEFERHTTDNVDYVTEIGNI